MSNIRLCFDGEFYAPTLIEMEIVPGFKNIIGYLYDD